MYLPELIPFFSYQEKLEKVDKKNFLKRLEEIKEKILKETHIKNLVLDKQKVRLITSKTELN